MAREKNPLTDIADNYTPESRHLNHQIRTLCAGHPVNRALGATLDAVAEMIGLMATELHAAEAICDCVGPDLKAAIRDNWDELCRVRAMASQVRTDQAGSA